MSNNSTTDAEAAAVRSFWFGAVRDGQPRPSWFRKDDNFDREICQRFLTMWERASEGAFDGWRGNADDCLALIVLLDQFPRNMFRGSARAFASDARALATARYAIEHGYDPLLKPVERMFIYLPLEHSEALADQDQCLRLMKSLSVFEETRDLHVWAEKHRVIIERFGRFPHRNELLGRESTAEEIEFLQQPGSRF